MTVLLSIKPEFAEKIFSGSKLYEFRRSIFKQKVSKVVVYVTAPIGMVWGEFTIDEVLHENVERLWDQTALHAGVERDFFLAYFAEKEMGYAIKIGQVTRYETPRSLREVYGVSAPQSFLYLLSKTATAS